MPQKEINLYRAVPPAPPLLLPELRLSKSVPDDGFPVGIRCSCSTANQTRPKITTECSNDSVTSLLSQSSLSASKRTFVFWGVWCVEVYGKARLQSSIHP